MSWSYDPSDLGTDDAAGRLNSVRFLVGDTNTNDQQVQDEEITFALAQTSNNIYYAAAFVANTIASQYSRKVTVELDGALKEDLSDLAKNYFRLAEKLREDGVKYGSGAFGIKAGGIRITQMNTNYLKPNRVKSAFYKDQFKNPQTVTGVEEDYDDWY